MQITVFADEPGTYWRCPRCGSLRRRTETYDPCMDAPAVAGALRHADAVRAVR